MNERSQSPSNMPAAASRSSAVIWTGRVLSGLAVAFLTFDAAMKVLQVPMAVEGTVALGYPANAVFRIGVVQLVCLALYLIPRTSLVGAVLWTGYLGGAIATQVRVGNPLFTHVLFPMYVAVLLWGLPPRLARRRHARRRNTRETMMSRAGSVRVVAEPDAGALR